MKFELRESSINVQREAILSAIRRAVATSSLRDGWCLSGEVYREYRASVGLPKLLTDRTLQTHLRTLDLEGAIERKVVRLFKERATNHYGVTSLIRIPVTSDPLLPYGVNVFPTHDGNVFIRAHVKLNRESAQHFARIIQHYTEEPLK